MRGSHIDEAQRPLREVIDANAILIHRHGDHFRAVALEGRQRAAIARILDGDRRTRPNEQAGNDVERFLDAVDDENLCRADIHPARRAEVIGDGMPQLQQSRRMRILG